MRVQKCYIAQRRTGEIVPARQVNMAESEECRCHHCQCPLIFHLPTRTSPSWFEHDIPRGQPEALLQCPQSLQQLNGNARCAACHMAVRNAALNAEKGYTVGRYEFSDTHQAIMGLIGTPESYYMGAYNFGVKINHFLSSGPWCLWIRNS